MPSKDAIFDILDEWGDTGNYEEAYQQIQREYRIYMPSRTKRDAGGRRLTYRNVGQPKPKRKLSAWNKFVKANSKKKIYKFANGKLKLKKMGIAFRKTRAGRKK
jgi:hypothetical protein